MKKNKELKQRKGLNITKDKKHKHGLLKLFLASSLIVATSSLLKRLNPASQFKLRKIGQ